MRDLRDPVIRGQSNIANIFGIDDMIIAALITATATGAGISASNKNAKAAQVANQQQNVLNERSLALSEKMDQEGLATQVDANGNITYYDQQTNTWRTILAPQQRQINDASNLELLRSLSIDAPMARGEALRNSNRRMGEAGTADALKMQLDNSVAGRGAQTSGDIASSLRQSRSRAVSAGFDGVNTALNTQAIRTGTGVETIGANLAKARSQQIAQTMGNPDLEGAQAAQDMNSTKMSNLLNAYSGMANRAGASDGYAPPNSNIATNLSNSVARQQQIGANGTLGAASIVNNIRVPAPVKAVDYSPMIASLGSILMSPGKSPSRTPSKSDYANDDYNHGYIPGT